MNIICNNCIGARIYEHKKMEFSNPFMWSLIPPKDFITLINEYDKIDFNNVKFSENVAIIDNKVKVYYVHYKFGKYKTPTKKGTDIYVDSLEDFVREKYFSRLKRMQEEPLFIISDRKNGYEEYVLKDLSLLEEINTNYKCVLITDKKKVNSKKMNRIVYVKDSSSATGALGAILIKELQI